MSKPYGEVLDEMDHQAKYQSATVDTKREAELRVQALGAAISRRDWHAAELAYTAIRDSFYGPADQPVAWITTSGLDGWKSGDQPESHVLLRTGGDLRVPLYAGVQNK